MDIYALTTKKRPTQLTMANNPTPEVRSSVGSASEPGTPTPTGRAVMLGKEGAAGEKVIVAGGSTVEGFSETVTGPPTREHWKPDSSATTCAHPTCATLFGLFERRHHCRRCGDLFCAAHCTRFVRLDQNAQFNPNGVAAKACDACAKEADRWATRRKSNVVSTPGTQTASTGPAVAAAPGQTSGKIVRRVGGGPQGMEGVTELGREDIVRPQPEGIKIASSRVPETNFNPTPSVPADWQWSTF
ncbi:hypothetical protein BC938DRAFT_474368 [Jimgerdemannia flammicorona]|uniref:FYVE-type domain-containing protein n=1 Tax=Jimgerdemannia flammicorona TaxID=994334 RepID=A0A433QSL7_9FUNG|nr:hypothetical protein BC938DRAFT_474368 [Jimgerdemannia flammicorona]